MPQNKNIIFTKRFWILFVMLIFSIGIYLISTEQINFSRDTVTEKITKEGPYEVDLVYLWCDGDEPQFRERKNYWLKQGNKEPDPRATSAGRFVQVDELKYSLRSVEEYLPWLRHIYIVTDRQVPIWLNTEHPNITVVDHSEIIPKQYIPVFNSNAIESVIYKIPGLTEHFLYSNDDMFVNRPLSKGFFFRDGKPIIRMRYSILNPESLYQAQLINAITLAEHEFNSEIPFFSERNLIPHHNIDAYLKSDYADCAHHFEKQYQETLTHRFRKENSIQRLIVSIWSLMKDHAQVKIVPPFKKKSKKIDSIYIANTKTDYAKRIDRQNPGLFCLNDSEFSTPEDRLRVKTFLESRFPKKSKFEK